MKFRSSVGARPVAGVGVLAVLLASAFWGAGGAVAATPEIVDPAGDATPVWRSCDLVEMPVCTPRAGSLDALDIVEGDLSTAGSDLVFSMTLVDLGAAGSGEPGYQMRASGNGLEINVGPDDWNRPSGRLYVYGPDYAWGVTAEVAMTVDPAANTVSWVLPLADLNALVAPACPSCPAFATGTVIDWSYASAGFVNSPVQDAAVSHTSYTVGSA